MFRLMSVLSGVAIVALVAGTAIVVLRGNSGAQCTASTIAGGTFGGPFTLVNGDGVAVQDTDVITEPTLLYFGYTFCPDVCPIDSARNAAAVDILAESGISATPVFITVDPERDTVDVVRDYAANFHPKMIGLTGSAAQVAQAAKAYRVVHRKADDDPEYYLVDHSVFTYLVTPQDGFVDFFRREASPQEMADRVSCLIDGV